MLYAHGSDLCHELELRHAMANCFEALMGALLLDGGIKVADKVFAEALFLENSALKDVSDTITHGRFEWNKINFRCRCGYTILPIHCRSRNRWAIVN